MSDISDADLSKLRPISFTYKPELLMGTEEQKGFIAEEVAEIAPEFVLFDEDDDPVGIKYGELAVSLANKVKQRDSMLESILRS